MITKRNKVRSYILLILSILLLLSGCSNTKDSSIENATATTEEYREVTTQKVGKDFITEVIEHNASFVFNKKTGEFKLDCMGNFISYYADETEDGDIIFYQLSDIPYYHLEDVEELNADHVKSIYFKEGINLIDRNPFCYFKNVTELTIPKSTKRILRGTFPKDMKIKTINYGGTPEEWEKVLIDNDGNEGIQNCNNINYNVKIEESTLSNYFVQRYNTTTYRDDKVKVTLDNYTGIVTVTGKGPTNISQEVSDSIAERFMVMPISQMTDGYRPPIEKTLVIEKGITRINECFNWESNINEVYLPKTLEAIDRNAFLYNDNLTDVYYAGSERQWKKIKIAKEGNESLLNAKIHYKVRYKE